MPSAPVWTPRRCLRRWRAIGRTGWRRGASRGAGTSARIERRPARLDLAAYPHLPKMEVKTTRAADYATLLPELAA